MARLRSACGWTVLTLLALGCLGGGSARAQQGGSAEVEQQDLQGALDRLLALTSQEARSTWAGRIAGDAEVVEWLRAIAIHRPWAVHGGDAAPGAGHAELSLGAKPGSMEVHWFVPAGDAPQGGWPVVLALHGSGGRADVEMSLWRAIAGAAGWAILAPQDPGENVGYRAGDPLEREVPLAALRWLALRYPLDLKRVVVTGTSRGGHLAWDLALRHPDRFCGLAPFIGGPRLMPAGGQNNLRFLEQIRHLSIRDLQGVGDDPMLIRNLRLAFQRLGEFEAPDVQLDLQADRGHSYSFDTVPWVEWLGALKPALRPREKITRLAAGPEAQPVWGVQITGVERSVQLNPPLQIRSGRWERMDPDEQGSWVDQKVREATARLQLRRTKPGRFKVDAEGVESFRLLLEVADLPGQEAVPGRVVVHWRRRLRLDYTLDAALLLRTYAEGLDPAALPVAAVEVRKP